MGKHWAGVVVACAVILAACSGGKNAAAPSATTAVPATTAQPMTSTTRPAGPTTTTSTPEYSFDDSVPPPEILDTGTNYVAIVKSLGEYGNWLSSHRPDPVLANKILAPGGRLLYFFSRDLTRLRDNRKRLIEQVRRPGIYTVISARSDAVSMRADESIRLHETVDDRGKVTSLVAYPEHSYSQVLIVSVQGHWRLAAYDPEQPTVNVHL